MLSRQQTSGRARSLLRRTQACNRTTQCRAAAQRCSIHILENEPFDRLTTLRIGGRTKYLAYVHTEEELACALRAAKDRSVPYHIIGRGSNLLLSSDVYTGMIVVTRITHSCSLHAAQGQRTSLQAEQSASQSTTASRGIPSRLTTVQARDLKGLDWSVVASHAEVDQWILTLGAGCQLNSVAVEAAKQGLAGLEFAAGIPGSLGGAISMNAGAHGKSMSDVVVAITVMDPATQQTYVISQEHLLWSYRSCDTTRNAGLIVTAASLLMQRDSAAPTKVATFLSRRAHTQPVNHASAGCIFRNPAGGLSAGALIEQCGLKGYTIGGATVSHKHANFILNSDGSATAEDCSTLIRHIQQVVKEQSGIDLQLEVCVL